MLFLANAQIIGFLGDEERPREACCVVGRVEGMAGTPPTLGGEEGMGIHFGGGKW